MYKECKREQSAERQKKIESTLIMLMQKKDFTEITVTEICKVCQIPRKAFYRYFEFKEDVLRAYTDHMLQNCMEYVFQDRTLNELGRKDIEELLYRYYIFWQKNPELLHGFLTSRILGELYVSVWKFTTGSITWMKKNEYLMTEKLDKERIYFIISGLLSTTLLWHRTQYKDAPQIMAIRTFDILTEPLLALNDKE